jgi:Lar family restriction alleviation protein
MEPKPCPFCGSSAEYIKPVTDTPAGKWGYMECGNCGARGPDVRTGYRPPDHWEDEAIVQWNQRN